MKKYFFLFFLFSFFIHPQGTWAFGRNPEMKTEYISKEKAIRITKEFCQSKKYNYAIDWDRPSATLETRVLKNDGSLSFGVVGKKVRVWWVLFYPIEGIDILAGRDRVGADVDAKTGMVYTKYNLSKI